MSGQTVSILIPTFNRKGLLVGTILSAYLQTYQDFRIIVYDDGSTDGTSQWVHAMQDPQDHTITVVRSDVNKGVGYARNQLLDACTTKIACWWDSDDLCNHHRLQLQIAEIDKGYDMVYAGFRHFHHAYSLNPSSMPILQKCPIAFASLMFRVDKGIRFLEERKFGGEDVAWSVQMKKKYKCTIIPRRLYYVRYHSNRIGSIKKRLTDSDRLKSYAEVVASKRL